MKKIKLNLALIAMVIAATAAFAFKPAAKGGKYFTQRYWYYNSSSTDEAQFKVASNYAITNNSETCITSGDRPCKVFVNADNTTQLQSILTPLAPEDVLDMSEGRKN